MTDFYTKYGPWALITGGSSGIGEEFAKQLGALGFNLILVARDKEKLDGVAKELTAKHKIEVKVIVVDLSNLESLKQIEAVTASLDVGLLVNNAGFALTGNFLDHNIEDELSLLHVNCRAPLALAHLFGKRMVQRGKGGIINVSSGIAFIPAPRWTNYAASKVYLLYFSEGLGYELKDKGVDVLALCPGGTRTNFSNVAGTKMHGIEPSIVVRSALKNLDKKSSVTVGFEIIMGMFVNRTLPRTWLIKLGAKIVSRMMNKSENK